MNLNKDYLIKVDVKKSTVDAQEMIFYINDLNTCNIFIKLLLDNSDNTEYKVYMNALMPNKKTIVGYEATVMDQEDLIYQIDLPKDYVSEIGTYKCEVIVVAGEEPDRKIIQSDRFTYKVKKSILTDV